MTTVIGTTMKCLECKNEFEVNPVWIAGKPVYQQRCDSCVNAIRKKTAEELELVERNVLETRWRNLCPPEFRTIEEGGKTDMNILLGAGDGVKKVMDWKPKTRASIAIYSKESGTMKTRAAWRLIKKFFMTTTNLIAISGPEFEQTLRERASVGDEVGWIHRCRDAEIFFVDDIDKACWSRWAKSAFFSILKARCEYDKMNIITTNQTGAEWERTFLVDKFGNPDEFSDPIIRRINNHFEVVIL